MTHWRNIRDVQQAGEPSVGAPCVRGRGLSACCKLFVVNISQLAESHARGEEALRRERHRAALIADTVCRIWQDWTRIGPSVRQQPPRCSSITETEAWHDFRFRAEERKLLCPKPLLRRVVGASQWIHVPWGNCASPSSPSHEEGVALLVTRVMRGSPCLQGVFTRETDTRTYDSVVCWVLASTVVPGTRYAAPGTKVSRLECVQRVLV